MSDTIIWLLVTGVVIGAILIHIYVWRRYHYVCPKCARSFKPTFLHSLFAVNAAEYRQLTCPHCQAKDYMEALKDKTKPS